MINQNRHMSAKPRGRMLDRIWVPLIAYTVLFVAIVAMTYGLIYLNSRSFIWEMDGIAQHFPILTELHKLLTSHESLSGWSWDLGLGGDKLSTFSYYVLGDPVNYLVALFPARLIERAYQLFIIIRLYAIGLAFIPFAKSLGFKHRNIVIGSLLYTFNSFTFYVSIHHPFFLMPLIFLPLLFWGIDRIYQGKSPIVMMIATAFTLLSNVYFAYLLGLVSFLYAIIRYIDMKMRRTLNRSILQILGHFALTIVVGILSAGILLIPTVIAMLSSTRVGGTNFANGFKLYTHDYYLTLPSSILSTNGVNYWLIFGITGLSFLGMIYVFKHFRENGALATGLILVFLGTLFPWVAATFNVMSSPSNRWVMVIQLPMALAAMVLLEHFNKLSTSDCWWMTIGCLLLLVVSWALIGGLFRDAHEVMAYVLLAATLVIVITPNLFLNHQSWRWPALGVAAFVSLISTGMGLYNTDASSYTEQQLFAGSATQWAKNYYDQVDQKLKQSASNFYRTSTTKGYYNYKTVNNDIPMLLGVHNIGAYYSVQDKKVLDFSESVGNSQSAMNDPIRSADHRTTLENVLGVRYLFMRIDQVGKQSMPYGFKYVRKANGHIRGFRDKKARGVGNNTGTVLSKNNNALPLAYVQTKQVTNAQYQKMSPWQREQSMTYGAVTEGKATGVKTAKVKNRSKTISYAVENLSHPLMNKRQVVLYRERNNFEKSISVLPESQSKSQIQTFTPKVDKDQKYGSGVYPATPTLQQALNKNRSIYEDNATENESGLHSITSDASGNVMVYKLNFKNPSKVKNTELYLDLSGISIKAPTTRDVLTQKWYVSVFRNETRSKFKEFQQMRSAILNPNVKGYSLTAETADNSNNSVQLGVNNMSDYEKKSHTLINLGYSTKNRKGVVLRLTGVTGLNIKKAKLIAVPFGKSYTNRLQKLKKTKLNNLTIHSNKVTGTTHNSTNGILTTSIPYSKGWKLTVDGQAKAAKVVNKGFVGAAVSAGHHKIVLTYHTPGLTLGKVATIIGLLGLVASGILFSGRFVEMKRKENRH